jgi:alanine-glyoxylate transaminase / serine-glyoxylate transaminase / serine-pyruvate transaminase
MPATIQPPKRLLFGPGPTMVEPRVYEALSQPVVGHLDPYMFEVLSDVRRLLRVAFGTKNEFTIAISGTGSSGMETAVGNFVEPDSKFAVFANGFFCDRLTEMGKRQNAQVVRLEKPWGETFTYEEASEFLRRERPQVIAFVHAETSTGALQDPSAICKAAREVDALVIADTVTSLGGVPVNVDEHGIDVAYSCTQKGLSCPPGLAPFTASPRALERLNARKSPVREWYLDLKLLAEYFDGRKYHHTASSSLFYALCEGLRVIDEEGWQNRCARHVRNHLELVKGLAKLGLPMHVAEGFRIPTLNTPKVPQGVDDAKVRKYLLEKHGIEIEGGFGPLAGKILRVGLMGPLSTESSVQMFLSALGEALKN